MKSRYSSATSLQQRLILYLRSRRAQRQQQRQHWLDAVAKAAPDDDDGLTDPAQQALRRGRMLGYIRARTQFQAPVRPMWPAWGTVLKVAAVLLPLLVVLGAVLWQQREPAQLRYVTGIGEYREVVLPDQSHVWLRPRSELRCAAAFGAVRAVQLRGEAFFSVTKDPSHPFVVRTTALTVRVLGTTFNVKAYPRLPATTVLVRTGRVRVARQNRTLAELLPQQQLVFNATTQQLTLTKHEYTAALPTNRMLTFEQASLREILLTLENHYPVRFDVPRAAPAVALSGTLDPSLSADQITDVLNTLLARHHLRIQKLTPTTYRVK